MTERRRDVHVKTKQDLDSTDSEAQTLPAPSSRFLRNSKKYQIVLLKRVLLTWIIGICFLCVCYWLWKPDESDQFHFQHEFYANFDAMKDWIWDKVIPCSSPIPNSLPIIGRAKLKNPSFTEGLKYWKSSFGSPTTINESGNSFWFAQARKTSKNTQVYSCSSQEINLSDILQMEISEEILSEKSDLKFASDDDKKVYLFKGLIDYNSILINVTGSLKNDIPFNKLTTCGTRNHFCDKNFHDHIWYEIDFYVSN